MKFAEKKIGLAMTPRPILPLSIAYVPFRLIRSGTALVLFTLALSCPNLFADVSGPFTYTSDSTGVTITECDPSMSGAVSVQIGRAHV